MSWSPALRLEGVAEARPYNARVDQKKKLRERLDNPKVHMPGQNQAARVRLSLGMPRRK